MVSVANLYFRGHGFDSCRSHNFFFLCRFELIFTFLHLFPILSDGASFTLAVGQYEYPFAFILPHQIPSSYESLNGKVRYHVKAIIERSWKKNYACQLPFSVNAVVDLNTVQDAEVPNSAFPPRLSAKNLTDSV